MHVVGAHPLGVVERKQMLKPGDRVVMASDVKSYNHYEPGIYPGVVMEKEAGPDKVYVKWDSSWQTNGPVSVTKLLFEADAQVKFKELEVEFNAWAAPIKEQVKIAADALVKINTMVGDQPLNEMHDLLGPLFNAMDNLGWRTSSMLC
jgi:hypothetical protein